MIRLVWALLSLTRYTRLGIIPLEEEEEAVAAPEDKVLSFEHACRMRMRIWRRPVG